MFLRRKQVANEHMESSTSLVSREMQMKTSSRQGGCYQRERERENNNVGNDVKKSEPCALLM